MRTDCYLFCFIINAFFIANTAFTQTGTQVGNFDETWKEFLDNNKISNMSRLNMPDKRYEKPDYAKYLLMNTNTNFCQSKLESAENLMTEIQGMDPQLHESIPGFVKKMKDLEAKIKAYHTMDGIWKQFLQTEEVNLDELEDVTAAKTSCEKRTLAKYSYMTAYYHLCQGNVPRAKNIFESRTLRLAEKTTLRVKDVEGLASEVAKMKSLFQNMSKLESAWKKYVASGVSPGFDIELPLFPCYPIPNIKEYVLKGVADVCNSGPTMLEKIKNLQAKSGVVLNRELGGKVKELEAAIEVRERNLSALNKAWESFIPSNEVNRKYKYGYEYCNKEALIRAYIMDGFAYVCELAEDMLQKIETLQRSERISLDEITKVKINELAARYEEYEFNGEEIDRIWSKFVAQGDNLSEDYQSTDNYCDNIHQVKDWVMKGLSGDCIQGHQYLERIEAFQQTIEFNFFKELECRVQKLRIKVWDCRYQVLLELAQAQAPDSHEARLEELMEENGMGERPEVCESNG